MRKDLNLHAQGLRVPRSTIELHTHMVPPVGLEPTFAGVKTRSLSPFGQGGIGAEEGTRTLNIHLGKVAH